MIEKIPQKIIAGLFGVSLILGGGCSPTPTNTAQQAPPQTNTTQQTPPPQTTTTQPLNPPQPTTTAQQLSCTGTKVNGWNYDAAFQNGRFTQITWTRDGQPPQISPLTLDRNNDQGQPIYRGTFQQATAISLVDLGKGDVRPGSQVSVGTEEWGWARGTCAIAAVPLKN